MKKGRVFERKDERALGRKGSPLLTERQLDFKESARLSYVSSSDEL